MEQSMRAMRVVGIVGSLRRGSYNRRLLETARELAPAAMQIEIVDLAAIPLYNGDLDNDRERPAAVERLRRLVAECDAVLIATPEYNHSVPGVLQNAIDWLSRPAMRSPLAGKPVALIGASTGALGAARAQQQLKLVLLSTLALLMPHAGVALAHAAEKFDAAGALRHELTRRLLASFLDDMAHWIERVGRRSAAAEAVAA